MSEYRQELFQDRLGIARKIVSRLERRDNSGKRATSVLSTGFAQIDALMPHGGLVRGGIHEILGLAARRFTLHLLGRAVRETSAPALWAMPAAAGHSLYGPGLIAHNLAPDRLIIARCRTRQDLLWTLEEGLKSSAFVAVCGACDTPLGVTEARRLQLAAETGGTPGLLICDGQIPLSAPGSVTSRWYADPIPATLEDGRVQRQISLRLDRHRGSVRDAAQWRIALP